MSIVKDYVKNYFEKNGILEKNLPGFEYRSSQLEIALIIAEMLENGGFYIVEAGTGIGKTFAYLLPSILSQEKVVIATKSKNLQEQLYFKDINLIKNFIPFKFNSVYIKGRSNYICLRKLSKLSAKNVFFKQEIIENINKWVKKSVTGDIAELNEAYDSFNFLNITSSTDTCIGHKCDFFKECFIYKLKLEAEKSDIIIVNYHLLFADFKIKNEGFGKVLPEFNFLICDEAHNIEDIASDYFGNSISRYKFHHLISDIQDTKIKNFNTLQNSIDEFWLQFSSIPEMKKLDLVEVKNEKIEEKADKLIDELNIIRRKLKDKSFDEYLAIINRINDITHTINTLFFDNENLQIKWVEKTEKNISIKHAPVDISTYLNDFFYNLRGVAFTSATLSVNQNFNYFKSQIGIDVVDKEKIFPSTFNYKKQAVMFIPASIPFPNEKNFSKQMANILNDLLEITNGNAFVLFTNLRNMQTVYNLLKNNKKYNLLLQGEMPNLHLINNFKKNKNSVLFGSFSFWEGIDIQGENLSLVVIEKLPFSVPSDPLKKARIDKIREDGGNPFFDYQIPEAVTMLKQGIGRLIRSKDDIGIISIFDIRLIKKSYGKIFLKNLPEITIYNTLEPLKQNFQKLKNF